ncbi:MAG: glutamate racemase [Candidatus Cloacimonadota bacterium]|nr:MAG: glutamate racemase [Candidatus Cloacimonadota bacterium]
MIGVFDSGFGGLSVFDKISKQSPDLNLIYLGDSERTPYGPRSKETIYEWSKQAIDFLFERGCQLIIIACHTASNSALRQLQQDYLPNSKYKGRKILGVTIPIVEEVVLQAKKRVGVLATRGSIKSNRFIEEIKSRNSKLEIFQVASPMLVSLIEEGYSDSVACKQFIKHYLKPLKNKQIDLLVPGCTHFPLIFDQLQKKSGKNIKVLNASQIVADKLKDYLSRHPELEFNNKLTGYREYLTTGDVDLFQEIGHRFLKTSFAAKKVVLKFKLI